MLMTQDPRDLGTSPAPARHAAASTPTLPSLHDDPHQIHQLLDRLGLPPGTEVRVTTVAASVLVR